MKKSLALVLALVMVLSSFSFVSAADYSDVAGTMYEEPVARLSKLEVLKGYPDGSFKPEGSITRAEFAAVAVRARGLAGVAEAAAGLPSGFVDVPATHWAAGYVGTAGSMGIVNGIGNGMFAPNSLVKYEEAVTMLVRALGYEYDAQTKGGYPFGYLIVAEEIGLLDGARGTQGTFASRGLVAKLTDNALEIPMMIQIGTGMDARWVVSGEERSEEVYLLDYMGFDSVKGRVTDVDSDDLEVFIDDAEDDDWYEVEEGFDFYAVEGLVIKAWVDGDEVVVFAIEEDVMFDAVSYDESAAEMTLITADEDFDVSKDAVLTLDGEEMDDDFDADYAKVVFDDDGDVIWVEAFTFDGFLVVETAKSDVVADLNDAELDVEDYLIVKDGMTIASEDMEAGDILFYNAGEEFAVVYNSSEEGVIDRVYTSTTFRMAGTRYEFSKFAPLYLDGEDLGDLTEAEVDMMMDEESVVTLFFDFEGKVVLAVGDRGTAATSSYYAYVTATPARYMERNKYFINLDVVTEAGEYVEFDVQLAAANGTSGAIVWNPIGTADDLDQFVKGDVVKITVDEDGDLDKYVTLTSPQLFNNEDDPLEVTERYVGTKRLQDSAVVFWVETYKVTDDTDDIEVMKWADVDEEFSEVEKGSFYFNADNKVIVAVVEETDADLDYTEYFGLLKGVRKISGKTQWEITIEVEGKEYEFLTDTDAILSIDSNIAKGKFAIAHVGDKSEEIIGWGIVDDDEVTITSVNTTTGKIVAGSTTYSLVENYVVYKADNSKTNLSYLKAGDTVTLALDKAGSTFVKYVKFVSSNTPTTPVAGTEYLITDYEVTFSTPRFITEDINEVEKVFNLADYDLFFMNMTDRTKVMEVTYDEMVAALANWNNAAFNFTTAEYYVEYDNDGDLYVVFPAAYITFVETARANAILNAITLTVANPTADYPTITLPTTVDWDLETDAEAGIGTGGTETLVLNGNVITINRAPGNGAAGQVTVDITATAEVGDTTITRTWTITVPAWVNGGSPSVTIRPSV